MQNFCISTMPWSSLVEGDEQTDWPKSQTSMECWHTWAPYFWVFVINTRAYHLGQYSLHLLIQEVHGRGQSLVQSRLFEWAAQHYFSALPIREMHLPPPSTTTDNIRFLWIRFHSWYLWIECNQTVTTQHSRRLMMSLLGKKTDFAKS